MIVSGFNILPNNQITTKLVTVTQTVSVYDKIPLRGQIERRAWAEMAAPTHTGMAVSNSSLWTQLEADQSQSADSTLIIAIVIPSIFVLAGIVAGVCWWMGRKRHAQAPEAREDYDLKELPLSRTSSLSTVSTYVEPTSYTLKSLSAIPHQLVPTPQNRHSMCAKPESQPDSQPRLKSLHLVSRLRSPVDPIYDVIRTYEVGPRSSESRTAL